MFKDAAKKKLQNLGFSEPEVFEIQYMDLEEEVIFAALKLREEEAALLYPIHSSSSLPEKKKKKMSWVAFGLSMSLGAAAPWVIPNFLPDAVEQHQEEEVPSSCPPWAGDDAYRDIDC